MSGSVQQGQQRRARHANFTCEAEIRKNVMEGIAIKSEALGGAQPQGGPEMVERWIKFVAQKAADEGRLMSNQQFQDWAVGRDLVEGDRVRYIGPDREEVSLDGGRSVRSNGQVGLVVQVENDDGGNILTIYPNEPVQVSLPNGTVELKIVNMQVRVGTPGWLALERIPL